MWRKSHTNRVEHHGGKMMRVSDQKSSSSSNCLPFSFSDASTMQMLLSAQVAFTWLNRKMKLINHM
jgi:hypothetical protein